VGDTPPIVIGTPNWVGGDTTLRVLGVEVFGGGIVRDLVKNLDCVGDDSALEVLVVEV